jgi:type I restriction enzyme, S subunit
MGNNVTERGINWENVKFVSEEVNERFAQHALREGDVITVRVGAPGVTCVVPKNADGLNCGSLMIIRRSASFDSQWLSYVMNSFVVRSQIDLVQYGAAQEQINISAAVDFVIPTPPLSEQSAIAAFLSDQTAQVSVTVRSMTRC